MNGKTLARFAAVLAAGALAWADDRDAAVRKTVSDYVLARELHRDAKTMAGFFADEAELRNLDGSITRGKGAIEQIFARVLGDESASKLKGHTRIESVRFLEKDVALIALTNTWYSSSGAAAGQTMTSLVMRKDGKRWLIEASWTAIPRQVSASGTAR